MSIASSNATSGCLLVTQEAQKALGEAKRDIKQTSKELNAQLADMEESLATQLRRAERENSTVYLMRVPNIADLPLVQPHSVAKCALAAVKQVAWEVSRGFSARLLTDR